jgi:GxxExxY protein
MDIEGIGRTIIGSAIRIHSALGPGLLESAYKKCLVHELCKAGLRVETELVVPVFYDGITIEPGYRIDMLVENSVIIENKTVEKIMAIHEAQLLTYLKMKNCKLGYLINWNTQLVKDGIKRMVNGL